MKQNIISINWHIGDWLAGTIGMSTLEKGVYHELIMAMYLSGDKGLPNDDHILCRIAGLSIREWKKIKHIIVCKFQIEGCYWKQKRVSKELLRIENNSTVARANVLKRYTSHSTGVDDPYNGRSTNLDPLSLNHISKKEEKVKYRIDYLFQSHQSVSQFHDECRLLSDRNVTPFERDILDSILKDMQIFGGQTLITQKQLLKIIDIIAKYNPSMKEVLKTIIGEITK